MLIAMAVVIYGLSVCELFGGNGRSVMPGDLKGRCAVGEGELLMDDYESTSLTVVDQEGKRLHFSYGGDNGERIRYGNRETGWLQSEPGGDQEVALLKILRQTMATQFSPPPSESEKDFWDYRALKHSLFVLDYRCRHKTAAIPWAEVTEHRTVFGGEK